MGLGITVGQLAWSLAHSHHEEAELARQDIAEINRVLAAHGLPPHVEPETLPAFQDRSSVWAGFPYSWLHYLRRGRRVRSAGSQEVPPGGEGRRPGGGSPGRSRTLRPHG